MAAAAAVAAAALLVAGFARCGGSAVLDGPPRDADSKRAPDGDVRDATGGAPGEGGGAGQPGGAAAHGGLGDAGCEPGLARCGSDCVDLAADSQHCGACGAACGANRQCVAGACACAPPLAECDGQCVELQQDMKHCGACGKQCRCSCVAGVCDGGCPPPLCMCGGKCVDIGFDSLNCGFCSHPCGQGEVCNGKGSCSFECWHYFEWKKCQAEGPWNPYCAKLATDPSNCGECHHQCAPGESCAEGKCVAP
ncbi:MAG: hypothetical protein HY744_30760 [Deltaproteobacteria bacterium]|nr:hypothetical protein [Deltaproteobacteria bacterium]